MIFWRECENREQFFKTIPMSGIDVSFERVYNSNLQKYTLLVENSVIFDLQSKSFTFVDNFDDNTIYDLLTLIEESIGNKNKLIISYEVTETNIWNIFKVEREKNKPKHYLMKFLGLK